MRCLKIGSIGVLILAVAAAFLLLRHSRTHSAPPAPASKAASLPSSLGKKIGGFALKDQAGKEVALADFKDRKAVVVLFIGTECPINNAYMAVLVGLDKEYVGKGVQFLAINPNTQDSAEEIARHAKKHGIPFPVLKDEKCSVADGFGAQRTPEAFVLDGEGIVRYHGRIDDQFGIGYQRARPTRRDLAMAIDEVLAGKAVSVATTPVAGCLIGRDVQPRPDGNVTFAKHVSRLVQKHCQECHRPGMIGPMALLTYDDVKYWSGMIREVIEDRRMPPWHADPKHGKFANDRSLPKEDRDVLLAWIDQGCPRGDDRDLPPPRQFSSSEWMIGKPDVIFTMPREFRVPAQAARGVPYQYYFVPTNFTEDRWVQAVEAKPGNRAVVHHILVSARTLARGNSGDGIGDGLLVAQAPGELPTVLPDGAAKKIPKGAVLVFQMHYTPNGTEQSDRSSVGIIFAKQPPKYEVRTRAISNNRLAIPPGDASHKVTSRSTFSSDTMLMSLLPHMHLRGKSFDYRIVYPDGKEEVLLSVPRYDFSWQANYRLANPLRMPAGSRIECTAHFDNSAGNPNNPDPSITVRWGDQTWHEMMIGFVDYAVINDGK
jgi:peroxiredoxin